MDFQRIETEGRAPSPHDAFSTIYIQPIRCNATKTKPEVLRDSWTSENTIGNFQEALAALLGKDAKRLSAGTISRLKDHWRGDNARRQQRDLSCKHYVYFWADVVYFNIRGDEACQCKLVIVGVDEYGIKEFVDIEDGYRESKQSWLEVLSSR